tara:strand:- start:340 stop:702 length:363 start_codon:yes stop_codon:yes gene_type:complete
MKTDIKTNKLNWNGLTDKQQEFTEKLVNREVLTLASELIENALKRIDSDIEIQNYYNEETEEYYEIFCYFIVTDYLYEQLEKINACIFEYEGLYFWGRCDFGQGLDMNSELKQIAKNTIG